MFTLTLSMKCTLLLRLKCAILCTAWKMSANVYIKASISGGLLRNNIRQSANLLAPRCSAPQMADIDAFFSAASAEQVLIADPIGLATPCLAQMGQQEIKPGSI
jgi:hypothetical protein